MRKGRERIGTSDGLSAAPGQSLARPGPGPGPGRSNAQEPRSNPVGFAVNSARNLQSGPRAREGAGLDGDRDQLGPRRMRRPCYGRGRKCEDSGALDQAEIRVGDLPWPYP